MTEWQLGYHQAEADFNGEQGYLPPWVLAKYPPEFQAGYRTGQDEIEESIDNAAQARIFDH